jgi:L-aminopeptidase/D-esterase-like protein
MSQALPGALNLITDVPGLIVGQAHDVAARTGVTVVLAPDRAVAAVDVRGGGPGTRETEALAPENLVDAADAIVLAGGSVYGLAAADGVTAWLGARAQGFRLVAAAGVPPSPIVPSAILYDLGNGGEKAWGLDPPYRALGLAAASAASDRFDLGTAGAGYGAMAGRLKGGVGSASIVSAEGYRVGALAAVNAYGSAVVPGGRSFWAAPFEQGDEFGGVQPSGRRVAPEDWGLAKRAAAPRANTTLAVIGLDATLSPAQARRVAIMAQDGLARALRPAHAPFDGDVVFVLATGRRALAAPADFTLARLGALAADVLARAIARGVYEATPWPGSDALCWRDLV